MKEAAFQAQTDPESGGAPIVDRPGWWGSEHDAERHEPRKVAALVLNSVSHDARVIKEAESLAAVGFDVTIIGIRDNRDSVPAETLASGVKIQRVDWQPIRARRAARLASWAIAACLLVTATLLSIYIAARDGFLDTLVRTAEEIVTTILALDHEWEHIVANAIFLCGFAGLLAITVKLIRYRSQHVSRLDASLRAGRRGKWFARITFPFRELARQYAHFGAIEEAMLRAVESIEPDILHCHDLSSLPAGVKHKRRSSCVLVYDSHEIFEEAAGLTRFQRKFYRIQQRRYTPHVDHFITINESIGDFLTKRYPKLPDPVIVMNACLPALERPEYDGRLHDAAGLERSARILLYQGGFSPHRGLPQLVRAASLLPEEWTLVMMGWGRLEPKLREIATSVDPEGKRVRFIPGAPQSELVLWTQGAAAGVIPYENVCLNHWFCTPNKLWEYPNAGVPILASPFPELERVVVGEGVGWLLGDPITPEGIAAAVARIDDDELAAKRSACRRFIARSNWRIFETRLVDLYRSAARQRNSVPAVA